MSNSYFANNRSARRIVAVALLVPSLLLYAIHGALSGAVAAVGNAIDMWEA